MGEKISFACFQDELETVSFRNALFHQQLYRKRRDSRVEARNEYEKRISPVNFDVDDHVLLWSIELAVNAGKIFLNHGLDCRMLKQG